MRITGSRIALGPDRSERRDLYISGGRIRFSGESTSTLDLRGFLLLPGLINAHDHLEFNLFPKLGAGPYPNAKAWADDIFKPAESPVKEHIALSKLARWTWGGLKNLCSGVTTVAHHNPVDSVFRSRSPVNLVSRFGWAHSLDFSPDLADRLRATPRGWPFLLHAAEGIDDRARSEVARLDSINVLSSRTVLVHGIGLDQAGLELIRARGSGMVWCASSNLAIYGRTLSEAALRSGVRLALGTDSAMTAQSDLLDEIRVARRVSGLSAAELYGLVTRCPAQLLRLREGQGEIREDGIADLIAFPDCGQTPAESLDSRAPELVIVRGAIRLISPALLDRLDRRSPVRWRSIELEGRGRWFTGMDVASLQDETRRVLGPDYRLAGRQVSIGSVA